MRNFYASLSLVVLAGCATAPATPPEPPITVKLKGTAVEVQQFIEARIVQGSGGKSRVENATDRGIVFKTNCMDMPSMNALKCAAVMMTVGNSRWDGPYAMINFRTAEIRGVVNLSGSLDWCAINAFGKTNCMPGGSASEINDLLRKIEAAYAKES